MDIQIRKQLEQLEYIKDKLEYIEYDEALGCYIEKQDGLPTGVAAWVNGAFYGFEQAAKTKAVPEGFVLISQKDLLDLTVAINAVDLATHSENKTNEVREMWQDIAIKLMALGKAQEPAND